MKLSYSGDQFYLRHRNEGYTVGSISASNYIYSNGFNHLLDFLAYRYSHKFKSILVVDVILSGILL